MLFRLFILPILGLLFVANASEVAEVSDKMESIESPVCCEYKSDMTDSKFELITKELCETTAGSIVDNAHCK